jgi:hypothetical protein
MLVTVMIVGITFAVFVGGMGTSIVASDYHRKVAVGQASIRNFAEAVKSAPFNADCAPGTALAAYQTAYAPTPPTRQSAGSAFVLKTAHVAPSVLPVSSNGQLLNFYSLAASTTFTSPTMRWSERSTGVSPVTTGFVDEARPTTAATGSRTAVSALAANSVAQSVVLDASDPRTPNSVVRRGLTTAVGSAAATLTIAKPSGTAAGDAMVAQIVVRGAAAELKPPVGWNVVSATDDGSSVKSVIYERTATGAPATSFTWGFDAARDAVGGIVSYGGVMTGFTATVTAVQWLDDTGASIACDPNRNALQRVSLRVTSNDNASVETVDIVKRCKNKLAADDPCADT